MRYQVGKAIEQERVGRIVNVVKEMEDSMTVNVVYHSDDSNTGLALTKNEDYPRFCLYRAVNDQPDQLYIGILAVYRLFVYFCS